MDSVKKPPSLTSFFKLMRPLPELRGLKVKELKSLLKNLREAAETKLAHEAEAELSRNRVRQLRRERKSFLALGDHLDRASVHLQIACQKQREQLLVVEQHLPPDIRLSKPEAQVSRQRGFSGKRRPGTKTESERIAGYLMAARNRAQEYAAIHAAAIHPSSRTPAEKKAAKQWMSSIVVAPEQIGYPLIGVSTPAIDHWFIGKANLCLLEFESQFRAGLNVTNRLGILTELFKILFHETKSSESIRKELDRQKKNGVPEYGWPVRFVDPLGPIISLQKVQLAAEFRSSAKLKFHSHRN